MSLSKEQNAAVEHHLSKAQELHDKLPETHHDIINRHEGHFSTYINKTVREGSKPTTKGLRQHIEQRMGKELEKLSSDKGRAKKQGEINSALTYHDTHENHFQKALDIHHHVQAAKDILTKGLHDAQAKHNPMKQSIDGKETTPEGYTVHHKGQTVKMVNRKEFSQANFNKPKTWA